MATVKLVSAQEQNANILAGVQVDTAVYVGTGLAGVVTLRHGRDAPKYVLEGVQTAVTLGVVLETHNATQGATFRLRSGTAAAAGALGTSVLSVRNATTDGAVLSTASGVAALPAEFTFNGLAWV